MSEGNAPSMTWGTWTIDHSRPLAEWIVEMTT